MVAEDNSMVRIQKLSCRGGQLYVRTRLTALGAYATELPLRVDASAMVCLVVFFLRLDECVFFASY